MDFQHISTSHGPLPWFSMASFSFLWCFHAFQMLLRACRSCCHITSWTRCSFQKLFTVELWKLSCEDTMGHLLWGKQFGRLLKLKRHIVLTIMEIISERSSEISKSHMNPYDPIDMSSKQIIARKRTDVKQGNFQPSMYRRLGGSSDHWGWSLFASQIFRKMR